MIIIIIAVRRVIPAGSTGKLSAIFDALLSRAIGLSARGLSRTARAYNIVIIIVLFYDPAI